MEVVTETDDPTPAGRTLGSESLQQIPYYAAVERA
jgi:hypothetical protein